MGKRLFNYTSEILSVQLQDLSKNSYVTKRVMIASGETVTIDFEVDVQDLAFYDINMNLCVEMGEFEFMVGGSSDDKQLMSETVDIKKRYDY